MARIFYALILLFSYTVSFASADFEKIFNERSKCVVNIEFVNETEESRSVSQIMGIIADKTGLIIVTGDVFPKIERLSALKDFKARIHDGNPDGYPLKYLGYSEVTDSHFFKLVNGLVDGMRPISDFKRGNFNAGDNIWGIVMTSENMNYITAAFFGRVMLKGRFPYMQGFVDKRIGWNGTPVFSETGDFIGMGLARSGDPYYLEVNGNGGMVEIIDTYNTDKFIDLSEFDKAMKSVPRDPNGDKYSWYGFLPLQIVERDVAKYLGLGKKVALVVNDIIKDSPFAKGGFKKGDIIIGVDGKPIERLSNDLASQQNLTIELMRRPIGSKVVFDVIRDSGAPMKIEVVSEESLKNYRQSKFQYFKRLGFSVREFLINDSVMRKTFEKNFDGAVVQFVKPNSPAASALPVPLSPRDLILEINSKPVKGYAQAIEILQKIAEDKSVKELVVLAKTFNETKVVRIKLD